MKKITALVLALIVMAVFLPSCSKNADDKGAQFDIYLGSNIYDLDPAKMFYDDDSLKYINLIFEGLTRLDENGNVKAALAQKWDYSVDSRDGYLKLYFYLNETSWSDSVSVNAESVVYAWKRLLDPETLNPAASLLYPILNAKNVKLGVMTIDDIGLSAINSSTIEVVFEKDYTDVEKFIRNTASPALVALREDVVASNPDTWAQPLYIKVKNDDSASNTLVTNGPFSVKSWTDEYMILERSSYYRNLGTDKNYTKYVTPYKITIHFNENDSEANAVYSDNISAEQYESEKKNIKTSDSLSVYTYLFNTDNEILKNESVRKALSISVDRNKIAELRGGKVSPATGFIPRGVSGSSLKKDYRTETGDIINTSSDMEQAKKLISQSGISGGSFEITVSKEKKYEKDIAEYVCSVWKDLGFDVKVNEVTRDPSKKEYFYDVLENREYDVIGIDYIGLSDDAYNFVVPFACEYSGNTVDINDENAKKTAVTGFDDDSYDEIISGIELVNDSKSRYEVYKNAEQVLVDNAVVAPLVFNVNSRIISKDLSNIDTDYFGFDNFTKAKLKNYKKYIEQKNASE